MNRTALQILFAFFLSATALGQTVPILFQVDMSKVASLSPKGAHLAGTFNNWTPQAMNPVGGGRYELLLQLDENSSHEYKFANGTDDLEPSTNLVDCSSLAGNREVFPDDTGFDLPSVCFGECSGCVTKAHVSVDLSKTGFSGTTFLIYANGGHFAMTDDGNGIWSADIPAPNNSTIKYRFGEGLYEEPTADLAYCGVADGSGGFYRTVDVATADLTVPTVCWGRCGPCPKACAIDPDAVFCENFNSYTLTAVGPQSPNFSGQNGVDSGPEDPLVSAEQASDGGQSLKISGDNTGGATPGQTVLRLGNQSTGKFDLAWKMFFPAGHAAFFNIDAEEAGFDPVVTSIVSPAGDVFLNSGNGQNLGQTKVSNDTWVDFRLLVDLDADVAQLRIGQAYSQTIGFPKTLGGINFSGTLAPTILYYVDEIEFRQNALFKANFDDCKNGFDLSPYLVGGAATVSSQLFDNTGMTAETGLLGTECFTEDDFGGATEVQNSLWFQFNGNGRTYQIQTAPCDAGAAYIDGGDTQMAAYTGDCGALTPLGCNDDIGFQYVGDFRSGLVISSQAGSLYHIMVDGFDGSEGKFCLQFTQFQRLTFQLDASQIAADPDGMFVRGSWDGWGPEHAMTLDATDNLWKYTIEMPPGAIVEWKYQNGHDGWEDDSALAACGKDNGLGGFNRVTTIGPDLTLAPVCFGSCDACPHWYDECGYAEDITGYFGKGIGVVSATPIYSNINATTGPDEPTTGFDCFVDDNGPSLERTVFFEFIGDGKFYSIRTDSCAGNDNYLPAGDSQIAVYEGSNCQFGMPVACNDDFYIDGNPVGNDADFHAAVTMQTVAGQPYIIMVDGWNGTNGKFCLEIEEQSPIDCAQAAVGELESGELTICDGELDEILVNLDETIVATVNPVSGFTWVFTSEPIPSGWTGSPFDAPGYLFSTGISPNAYNLPIFNGGGLPPGTYFVTPIVVSGATHTSGSPDPLDLTGGCYVIGLPVTLNLVEPLDPIDATGTVTPATAPPGNNGAVTLDVTGGSGSGYEFEWSNGAFTQNISGLPAGTYSVTVTDPTGCVADEATFTVQLVNGTGELPPGVSSLSVLPNPTGGPVYFLMEMTENRPVSVRLVNSLGQTVDAQKFAEGEKASGSFDLSARAAGVYALRFEVAGRTAERRVVLVK